MTARQSIDWLIDWSIYLLIARQWIDWLIELIKWKSEIHGMIVLMSCWIG